MKIEPAVYVRKKAIDFLNGASKTAYVEAKLCRTKTNDFELTYPLYTEAQLRQLVEACAVAAWNTGMDLHMKQHDSREVGSAGAAAIRELIKELLP